MSYIEIFKFDENGDSESYGEVSNAWLGSMRVWNILGEKYCGHGASLFDMGQMEAIWNLVDDKSVTYDEKIVLFTTFDKYLVKKEDIPKVIDAFRKFEGNTNLNEQADVLESLYEEPNCIAVGFHQNSISCEQWFDYNCIQDKEHFWLFDEQKESEGAECQELE